MYLLIGLSVVMMVVVLVTTIDYDRRQAMVRVQLDEPQVYIHSTQAPDVRFNVNQQRAYIMLLVNKNLQAFNSFAGGNLSWDERCEVLNHIKLSDIS